MLAFFTRNPLVLALLAGFSYHLYHFAIRPTYCHVDEVQRGIFGGSSVVFGGSSGVFGRSRGVFGGSRGVFGGSSSGSWGWIMIRASHAICHRETVR